MDKKEFALKQHEDWHGKIEVVSRAKVTNREELSVAYTPGVAEPCLEISKDVDLSYKYTRRSNLVAVITDGTAVLGLVDIGPEAGMPVMEGKCALFKVFADVDAFPLCVRSKDVDEIVNTVKMIAGSFGGVNLEDISAPRCIEIERRLREECDIPVFHDDQHGTAVVVLASVLNALKVVGKDITEIKAVVNGAGSAGMAITRLLVSRGLKNVIMCDKYGSLYRGNPEMNSEQAKLAELTNPDNLDVKLDEAIVDADLFIGVSAPGILTEEMVAKMAKDPIVAAAALVNSLQTIVSRNMDPFNSSVLSITHLQAGNTWNVIPEQALIEGTVRTLTSEERELFGKRLKEITYGISQAYDLDTEIEWIAGPPATVNDEEWSNFAKAIAQAEKIAIGIPEATLGGEDFAFYLEKIRGTFIKIGTGKTYPNHHPKFKVNPAALSLAAKYLSQLAKQALLKLEADEND